MFPIPVLTFLESAKGAKNDMYFFLCRRKVEVILWRQSREDSYNILTRMVS